MRFSEVFAAASVATLVAAHGGVQGVPKVFGASEIFGKHKSRAIPRRNIPRAGYGGQLSARQGGVNGRCGSVAGGASCAAGFCCSIEGYCGQTKDHCQAPDCQFEFGPGCDANKWPSGTWLGDEPRPQLNADIPYGGEGIYDCVREGDVAITYDDGPYIYTNDVLDQFAAYGMKATFFVTGINIGKGAIDDPTTPWPAMMSRMIAEGHQIASHTWSHQDLSAISSNARIDQMVKLEMALRNIIGKWPTYMRPPYSSCTSASGCQADLADLGYVVSYFDLDTDDYNNVTPELIQNAKNNFANAINPSNPATDAFLAIAHDIHQQTAQNLTGYMLDLLTAKGYRGVTMGECMGDPEANWYRTGNGGPRPSTASSVPTSTPTGTPTGTSSAPSVTATGAPTTDGTCGPANGGKTCIGWELGECCSQYGWCGNTPDHCDAQCQPLFGNCGGSTPSSSSPATTAAGSSTSAAPTSTPSVGVTSPDGTCGPANSGYTCIGFELGECCSQYGWCGSTADHCDAACQPLFGNCGSSPAVSSSSSLIVASSSASSSSASASPSVSAVVSSSSSSVGLSSAASSSATSFATSTVRTSTVTPTPTRTATPTSTRTPTPTPTPTSNVSKDGLCGGRTAQTCQGFGNKECCRFDGKCGSDLLACGLGCQKKFGKCWW